MKLGRRGFLGGLAGGAAMGPRNLARLATRSGSMSDAMLLDDGEDATDDMGEDGMDYGHAVKYGKDKDGIKLPEVFSGPEGFLRFLGEHGVPEHMRGQWKDTAKRVRRLDADLVDNRSMSRSAKIIIQRERELMRMEREWIEQASQNGLDRIYDGNSLRRKFYEKFPWARYLSGI